jgi:hypothetical protein
MLSQRAVEQSLGSEFHQSVIDPVTLAGVERKLAECALYLGHHKEVLKHLEAALLLLKQPFPSSNSGNMTSLLGKERTLTKLTFTRRGCRSRMASLQIHTYYQFYGSKRYS